MDVDTYDSLDGQVALVTGATRGLGEGIATALADLGATVYGGGRDPDDVTGDGLRPIRLDVTREEEIVAATERIADEAGSLDVLVNNAGVEGPETPLAEERTEDIDRTLDTNLRGAILATKHAIPLLEDGAPGGRVVNVSSRAGQFHVSSKGGQFHGGLDDDHLPYAVSKCGLNGFTSVLADQYPELLINAATPGWVATDMGGSEAPRNVAEGADVMIWLSRFKPGSPSGKFWGDREIIEW